MPPELTLQRRSIEWFARIPADWRRPLTHLALGWALVFALTAGEWAAMALQWWNSSTYNHVLLVPAIVIWLVWLRTNELALLTPRAWWPGLVLVAGSLFVWLLGATAGFNSASQLGAVLALQAVAVTLLGPRVAAGLLFPLAYMLFLVPIGDELVPTLQLVTAKLAIALTHWSGVPAEIDGVFIDTPAGLFEVAEACSGVKFLIAMIALGTLVAHLCYRSAWRRLAFMALAVVLPILANGVRAWGTIYIAQSRGVEFAAGFDHIFYGWIFFGLVMAALLAIGWRFFDRAPDDAAVDADRIANSALLTWLGRFHAPTSTVLASLAVAVVIFSVWGAAVGNLESRLPERVALPEVAGWQSTGDSSDVAWVPRGRGADFRLLRHYRDDAGRQVDVFLAVYRAQTGGREAGAFGEGALIPGTAWRWLEPGDALAGGHGEWMQANGHVRRLAITWYRRGQLVTGSNGRLKLAAMADRLMMRARPTMMLIVSAEDRPGRPARSSIEAFLGATGEPGAWMDGIVQLP